jgi:hypothetical protein
MLWPKPVGDKLAICEKMVGACNYHLSTEFPAFHMATLCPASAGRHGVFNMIVSSSFVKPRCPPSSQPVTSYPQGG